MINAFVKGQTLKITQPLVVAKTIDYLEMKFIFQTGDWAGLVKWAHFKQGETQYDIMLHDDSISRESHLNLGAGKWDVYLHGNDTNGNMRVTTDVQPINVTETGFIDVPLPDVPLSTAEQISAVAQDAKNIAQSVRDDADRLLMSNEEIKQNTEKAVNAANAAAASKYAAAGSAESAKGSAASASQSANDAKKSAEDAAADALKTAADAKAVAADKASVELNAAESAQSAANAAAYAENAKASETAAKGSQTAAKTSEANAANYATSAQNSATTAEEKATAAGASETNAKQSETNAQKYATAAESSKTAAENASTNADASEKASAQHETAASGSADRAEQAAQKAETIIDDSAITTDKTWSSRNIIKQTADRFAPPFQQKAPIVSGELVADYPMGVKTYIEPVQEGEGDPRPDNVRPIKGFSSVELKKCGKNLLEKFTDTANHGITFVVNDDGTILANGTASQQARCILYPNISLGEKTAFLSGGVSEQFVIEAKVLQNGKAKYVRDTGNGIAISGGKVEYVACIATDGAQASNVVYKPALSVGTSIAQYEPYQGETLMQELPEEVYGGVYDWKTGVLMVDKLAYTITGTENIRYNPKTSWDEFYFVLKGEGANGGLCTHFSYGIPNGEYKIVVSDACYFTMPKGMYSTTDQVKQFFADAYANGKPVNVVYPIPHKAIPLTPHMDLTAYNGITTVYSSTGDTEVNARENPNAETKRLQKQIDELKNAIISMGGNI